MMGYTFAIAAIVIFAILFLLFRSVGSGRRASEKRDDYRKGTTYEKPVAEEPRPQHNP